MSLIKINRQPSVRDLRVFALLSVVFATVLASTAQIKGWSQLAVTITGLGLLTGMAAILRPKSLKPVYLTTVYLTLPIGYVVSHLILAVIYYLLITPMGLIMRLARYDPLKRKFEPTAKSYWITRSDNRSPTTYFRQY